MHFSAKTKFVRIFLKMSSISIILAILFSTKDICFAKETCDEIGDIDESLNNLAQDDPTLISALQDYYLNKPAAGFKYNIPEERLRPPQINGQFQQALIVDLLYNSSKRDGFFVEAGAFDGYTLSNSLFFEVNRGWTGLLAEANPDAYETLLSSNRKSWSIGHCLSMKNKPEVVEFDAAGIFGGILWGNRPKPGDNLPVTDRERLQKIVDESRRFIKMQCFPLYSLLLAIGNTKVDYLSLDVEGAEEGVLKSIPWDKVDIKVISLESVRGKLNENASGNHVDHYPAIHDFLSSVGYTQIRHDYHTPENITCECYFVKNDMLSQINPKYANFNLDKLP